VNAGAVQESRAFRGSATRYCWQTEEVTPLADENDHAMPDVKPDDHGRGENLIDPAHARDPIAHEQ